MTRRNLIAIAALALSPATLAETSLVAASPAPWDEEALPRNMTPEEQAIVAESPITAVSLRGASSPTGPIACPGEYEPMDGILVAWEGSSAWKSILAQMGAQITTTGAANFYVVVDTAGEASSAFSSIASAGANTTRVETIIRTTDTIWMRDYGPRYIYEGDCRAIVDHTYNRPRPNDNLLPSHLETIWGHTRYDIPLVHGGGNYHLDTTGLARTTRLINNENPGLTETQIDGIWADYQEVDTDFYTPFPTFVDATQHIDMWMQIFDDDKVMISDWPSNVGSTQDQICDSTAADMAAEGYQVFRVPARSLSGTHYTYTNVVICNDLILLPTYTNSTIVSAGHNAEALAAWQSAAPGKTVVQINCQAIVTAAGVMHCIVMHVPEHLGGLNPTAYLRNLNGGEILDPDDIIELEWITDDDESVSNVDILLSTDGGATFPTTIASMTADDGSFFWTVPDIFSDDAQIRVVARDAGGRTGFDGSDASFTINGVNPCPADLDGDGAVGAGDLAQLIGLWGSSNAAADLDGSGVVGATDLAQLIGNWGPCP